MALGLLEGAIDALYAYLYANIAVALDAVDAHHADTITLEDIQVWYKGSVPMSLPEYPSIWLEGISFTPSRNMKKSNLDCKYRIDIYVFIGCNDEQERFRRLDRYAQAILALMEDAVNQSTFLYEYQWAGAVMKLPEFQEGGWLQAIRIPIELSAMETY